LRRGWKSVSAAAFPLAHAVGLYELTPAEEYLESVGVNLRKPTFRKKWYQNFNKRMKELEMLKR